MKCDISKEIECSLEAPKPGVPFYLKYYSHNGNTRQNMKNSIISKNHHTSKTLKEFETLYID